MSSNIRYLELVLLAVLPPMAALFVTQYAEIPALAEVDSVEALAAIDVLRETMRNYIAVGAVVAGLLVFFRFRELNKGGGIGSDVIRSLKTPEAASTIRKATEEGILDGNDAEVLLSFVQMRSSVASRLNNHRQLLEHMGTQLTALSELLTQSRDTVSQVTETVDESQQFHQGISESVDGLARSAEATSSSILEMVAINNEVSENIHNLASSVEETTTAIEEMTFSVKEVAKNIEELSTASEETAASMNEMDVSISQVETNADETTRLSEQVMQDAETGVSAINQTISGIDRIKESSQIAADVITELGERIDAIGNILTVIDDVAEQTNLLALNAAIIAAQAGEHGRGFAVVADEIKALAERTGASTKEIADLIKTIQSESRKAINVMHKGVQDVDDGVKLGHNAEDALRKIVDSAKRSTLMIKAIAQATVEQARGSKQVTNAISRIAETVQQIARATAEQAKGSEQIMKSAERMRVITQQVERSTEEQNRGGRQVTEAIENIRDIVDKVSRNQASQVAADENLGGFTKSARDTSTHALTVCRDLTSSLSEASLDLEDVEAQP